MPKATHPTLPTGPELVLPERVTVALAELAGAAREGPLALAVGTGLGVLDSLLNTDVDQLVGPKGRHQPDRAAGAPLPRHRQCRCAEGGGLAAPAARLANPTTAVCCLRLAGRHRPHHAKQVARSSVRITGCAHHGQAVAPQPAPRCATSAGW